MNDALATVLIVVMAVLIAWQWWRYEIAMREIERLQSIISLYRKRGGFVFGAQEVREP